MWNPFSVILKEAFDSPPDSPREAQWASEMCPGIWMAPEAGPNIYMQTRWLWEMVFF